jgi:DNA-binding GntR family transcriptional regulator
MAREMGQSARPAKKSDRLLIELRDRIARQKLHPGSKLQEQVLAKEFGVSRARIREVFGALEQRGLIERIPNRGAVVVQLEPSQVFELYHVREVLEGLAARLASRNAPDGSWAALAEEFGEPLERAVNACQFETYLATLKVLNDTILFHSRNELLKTFLDLIYDKTQIYARRAIVLPGRARIGLELHRRLLKALADRDAAEAERVKHEIIGGAKKALEEFKEFVL